MKTKKKMKVKNEEKLRGIFFGECKVIGGVSSSTICEGIYVVKTILSFFKSGGGVGWKGRVMKMEKGV